MPWKEYKKMDAKIKFIARYLEGEPMASLCREFGITRKTGYRIKERYLTCGAESLAERSRKPYHHPNRLPMLMETLIVDTKKEKITWGARKIRERIKRKHPGILLPAVSTIHAVLDRNGLVCKNKRTRRKAQGTLLKHTETPNALWCADYKGEFLLGNKQYCYPLTITDYRSRYLLACEALDSTKTVTAVTVFENAFKKFGLPYAIRTDNGTPFSSSQSLCGLSRLSVWWIRLGIRIERIAPGCPQQNGRHERMHLTFKQETTRPAGDNSFQQQEKFDHFIHEYNQERPHDSLNMQYPAEVYEPSPRPYEGITDIDYPLHEHTRIVTTAGRICFHGQRIFFSKVFAGQKVGIRQIDDRIWQVSFMQYDIGYFDEEMDRIEPAKFPFGANLLDEKVYTMS